VAGEEEFMSDFHRPEDVYKEADRNLSPLSIISGPSVNFNPIMSEYRSKARGFLKEAEKYTVRIYGSTVVALETSYRGVWNGSGFVVHIDKENNCAFVTTNKHIIGDGISSLQISFKDGERLPAIPVYIDPIYDFGVLKFKLTEVGVPPDIIPAELGFSDKVDVGLPVGTFGNPVGLEYCATEGVISSVTNRPGSFVGTFLQTDAAINPGNSGGPLISLEDGKVIGVNTATGYNVAGIGWSLAIDQLKPLIEEVIKGDIPYSGHMGWTGLLVNEINVDRAKEDFGAKFSFPLPRKALIITGILQESPGEKSGFKKGDIILSVDNSVPVDGADFSVKMRSIAEKITDFLVCRLGQEIHLKVKALDGGILRPESYVTFAGMVIQPSTPTVYEWYYSWITPDCVYITDILEGTSAQTWGARRGAVTGLVIKLTYYRIRSLQDFWNAIKDVKPGQPVEIFYLTDNWGSIVKVVYYSDHEAPEWHDVSSKK